MCNESGVVGMLPSPRVRSGLHFVSEWWCFSPLTHGRKAYTHTQGERTGTTQSRKILHSGAVIFTVGSSDFESGVSTFEGS